MRDLLGGGGGGQTGDINFSGSHGCLADGIGF